MLFSDVLHYVIQHCPACPPTVAEHHFRHAAIEFFDRADLWLAEFTLAGDGVKTSFVLGNPPGYLELADVRRLTSVSVGGIPVPCVSRLRADEAVDAGDTSLYCYTDDLRNIVFSRPPDLDAQIKIRAAMKPNMDARTMPDIAAQWIEGIAAGAVSKLLLLPEWFDGARSDHFAGIFIKSAGRAAAQASRGFSPYRRGVRAHFY